MKQISRATRLERSCVRVAFRASSRTSFVRVLREIQRTRWRVRKRTAAEREASERKKGAPRGRLPRRMSLGVCPPGRGERAVTERDGVTKEGTRMRWNGTYTFSSLPHRCFAEEGAYRHGAHGNAQAPSAEDPRPFDVLVASLAFSLSSLSHPLSLSRTLTFPRSSSLSLSYRPFALRSIHPSVCLRLYHFSSNLVTIPMAAFSP